MAPYLPYCKTDKELYFLQFLKKKFSKNIIFRNGRLITYDLIYYNKYNIVILKLVFYRKDIHFF